MELKKLLPILLLCLGCEKPLEIPPAGSYLPELCAVVGVIGGESAPPQPPAPAPPAPKPDSDVCPNCNGTGKLGDGRVEIVCPVCDGSGKVTQGQATRNLIRFASHAKASADEAESLRARAVIGNARLAEQAAEIAKLKAEQTEAVPVVFGKATGFWGASLKEARERATAENKPLLIHWWASWCGPCRNMERMVLSQSHVQQSLDGIVVAVKTDADEDKQRTKTWEVNELPKDMLVSPDYKKRIDLPLTIDADKYVERVTEAAKEVQKFIDAKKDSDVRHVVHEVVVERPVYVEPTVPASCDGFPPGYRGGWGGGNCSGGSCSSGNCGMGFW